MGFIAKNIGHKRILKPLDTKSKKRDSLLDLLLYADNNVPFYKGRYNQFLKQQGEWDDVQFWEEFAKTPITTKQDLKDHNDDFCSHIYAKKKMIVEAGETPKALDILKSVFIKKDFKISISTGGSSCVVTAPMGRRPCPLRWRWPPSRRSARRRSRRAPCPAGWR